MLLLLLLLLSLISYCISDNSNVIIDENNDVNINNNNNNNNNNNINNNYTKIYNHKSVATCLKNYGNCFNVLTDMRKFEKPVILSVGSDIITSLLATIIMREKLGIFVDLVIELNYGGSISSFENLATNKNQINLFVLPYEESRRNYTLDKRIVDDAGYLGVVAKDYLFVSNHLKLKMKNLNVQSLLQNDNLLLNENDKKIHYYSGRGLISNNNNNNNSNVNNNNIIYKLFSKKGFDFIEYSSWYEFQENITLLLLNNNSNTIFIDTFPSPIFAKQSPIYNLYHKISFDNYYNNNDKEIENEEEIFPYLMVKKYVSSNIKLINPYAYEFIRKFSITSSDHIKIINRYYETKNICEAACDFLKSDSLLWRVYLPRSVEESIKIGALDNLQESSRIRTFLWFLLFSAIIFSIYRIRLSTLSAVDSKSFIDFFKFIFSFILMSIWYVIRIFQNTNNSSHNNNSNSNNNNSNSNRNSGSSSGSSSSGSSSSSSSSSSSNINSSSSNLTNRR
jgi:hypothetical protein